MPQALEVSITTLLKLLGLIALLWFLFLIRDILLLLFVAIILMSALNPLVDWFEKFKLPRALGTAAIFILLFCFLGLLVKIVIPPVVSQTQEFILHLPDFAEELASLLVFGDKVRAEREILLFTEQFISSLSHEITRAPAGIIKAGKGVVNLVISTFFLLVFTFYLICEHKKVKSFLVLLIPPEKRDEGRRVIGGIEKKLGAWFRGQVILSLVVGFSAWLGLTALRIPFALPLALLTGILEIIPSVGPVAAAIPAVIVAATISPLKFVSVIVLYWLIQQLENYFLVPKVMQKTVGLDPLAVILALMIGARLMGSLGAVLSVPATITLFIIILSLTKKR